MIDRLAARFERHFGRPPTCAVRAPGRVNLIGEHTDYNEGLVLPCAIDRDTVALAASRDDGEVRVRSETLDAEGRFALVSLVRRGDWLDYVQAPAFALREAGHAPSGLDLLVASEVPVGSGLSSSAALGVAVALAFDRISGLGLAPEQLAHAVHRGESHFVGVGCGILDMYASALGQRGCALRIDCRDRSVRLVPIAGGGLALLVADSGVSRALARGGYTERVAECRAALAAAREAGIAAPDATALRDLSPEQLPALEAALPPRLLRRVRHVLRENARVDAFCAALEAGNPARAGALLKEGMASLRHDYEVSTPELDRLCALGDAAPGCHGSRLVGAGFGGCTLHLVDAEAAAEVAAAIASGFASSFGRDPRVIVAHPSQGAGDLPLHS